MILGVDVAIMKDGKVLLTQREDFNVWCLPGGSVDPNEAAAYAAIREVREEVGLEVRLTRMVGIYSAPGWAEGGLHIVTFVAEPTGGTLRPLPAEVIRAEYFSPDELPTDIMFGQLKRLQDALAGIGGSAVVSETYVYPPDVPQPRRALYAHRDQSGMSRADYYWKVFGVFHNTRPVIEIEGKPGTMDAAT